MPYKDPEVARAKSREYVARSRARNREAYNARARERRQQDPERFREIDRAYKARNAEKVRERGRVQGKKQYEKNREARKQRQREYYAANAAQIREKDRLRRSPAVLRAKRMYFKHGMRPEDWAALWRSQDGRCYLCGDELDLAKAVLDHDHSCCPAEASCRVCQRGLACPKCNSSIGLASDDPARLRRMADALEAANSAVAERMTQSERQGLLFGEESESA